MIIFGEMKRFCLTLILSIVILSQVTKQSTTLLPVPQHVFAKVALSIQKLQALLKTFNTLFQNKFAIYQRVELTRMYLSEMGQSLSQYNNVILGSGNSVKGNQNFVLGNYDEIDGSNNWVFVSHFKGKIDGDLLIEDWRIELDKSNLILINPRFSISFLKDTRNKYFKKRYMSTNRQLCKWDKWTNPQNSKSNQFWKKYKGYPEWRASFLGQLTRNLKTTLGGVLGGVGGLFGLRK